MVVQRGLVKAHAFLIRCVNYLPCRYECTIKYAANSYIPDGPVLCHVDSRATPAPGKP
jgi:hypothetical protein